MVTVNHPEYFFGRPYDPDVTQCPSVKREDGDKFRKWQCELIAYHDDPRHRSFAGKRTWKESENAVEG